MKLAVTGSRNINDEAAIFSAIEEYIRDMRSSTPDACISILSGGANGVQSVAKKFAESRGYDFILFEPHHELDRGIPFSARNFFTRNFALISNADAVLAIWDGNDSNTDHAIEVAKKLKKPIMIEVPDNLEEYNDKKRA